jgi:hypothetical protein
VQHIDVKLKHKTLDKVLILETLNPNLNKLCSHNNEHMYFTIYYCNIKTPNSPKGNHKDKNKNNRKSNSIKCYNSITNAS